MDEKQRQQLRNLLDIFLRRKKLIIGCFLLCLVGGLLTYLILPKVYQSTALLAYKQQDVGPSEMAPDSKAKFLEILGTFSNQITSRANLEDLIVNYHLYPELRGEKKIEDLVETMRKNIAVVPIEQGDMFRISYDGESPQKTRQVTNALAAKFIEENLRYREEWATDNLAYIKDQLRLAKETLDRKEQAMSEYKKKHYNEMPEERNSNLQRLTALQTQYQQLQSSVQDLERTRILVQEQMSLRRNMLSQLATTTVTTDSVDFGLGNDVSDLARAQAQLESLQARYTERHPDIIRLKQYIQRLASSGFGAGQADGSGQENRWGAADPQMEKLSLQLKEIEMSMSSLRQEQQDVKEQIRQYQTWLDAAPAREAEWGALTRDYDEYRKYYENLVAKSLEAESADIRERRQRGSQFAIVDPASDPQKPIKPSFLVVMLLAAVIGLSLGGGGAYLLENLDTSFKDANDLESYLGLPVACAVPFVHTESEERRQRVRYTAWTVVLVISCFSILGGILYLWSQNLVII